MHEAGDQSGLGTNSDSHIMAMAGPRDLPDEVLPVPRTTRVAVDLGEALDELRRGQAFEGADLVFNGIRHPRLLRMGLRCRRP